MNITSYRQVEAGTKLIQKSTGKMFLCIGRGDRRNHGTYDIIRITGTVEMKPFKLVRTISFQTACSDYTIV